MWTYVLMWNCGHAVDICPDVELWLCCGCMSVCGIVAVLWMYVLMWNCGRAVDVCPDVELWPCCGCMS